MKYTLAAIVAGLIFSGCSATDTTSCQEFERFVDAHQRCRADPKCVTTPESYAEAARAERRLEDCKEGA